MDEMKVLKDLVFQVSPFCADSRPMFLFTNERRDAIKWAVASIEKLEIENTLLKLKAPQISELLRAGGFDISWEAVDKILAGWSLRPEWGREFGGW